MVSGIGPFGTLAGSSTAARNAARSPARKAASIFLNFSNSAHRSASDFILPPIAYGLGFNSADNASKPRSNHRPFCQRIPEHRFPAVRDRPPLSPEGVRRLHARR